ncbi:hypothetical protein RHMOL_Rhmol03G0049100 [Rhododendron molle]|uniref:Uncharacterized protein n=1 Tax=Rhododendron molle TaxID=49168 RepID=A0ACC0PC80_RHOML|nr:hypothetical protein RHMOL_Rhmol03G0049100 [Rhododendron molle]
MGLMMPSIIMAEVITEVADTTEVAVITEVVDITEVAVIMEAVVAADMEVDTEAAVTKLINKLMGLTMPSIIVAAIITEALTIGARITEVAAITEVAEVDMEAAVMKKKEINIVGDFSVFASVFFSVFLYRRVSPVRFCTSLGAPDLVGDGGGQITRCLLRIDPVSLVLVCPFVCCFGAGGFGGGVVGEIYFILVGFFCCIASRFQRYFIVYGLELWIPFDPLLSGLRLVLKYPRYRGACFGSRCLRSTFR